MAAFGSFAILLGLVLCVYNLLVGAIALRQIAVHPHASLGPERLAESARRAGIGSFIALSAAAFALVYCAFTNDFAVSYILHHSNRALPAPYKFAALWSGQEGSLLLWAWLLAGYGFVLRVRHKVDVKLTAYASTILAGIQVFFTLLLVFAAPPFALVRGAVPADGFGLNPLLQYPEMAIHPPMLYLGYVGFSVPFAFALGALMMRYPGEKWIHITRRWTMVTWLFLTIGIFLGMHWAYAVLGWGGYWGWDPVENASVMPWLTGTAFLHSVMMQEKRGMMKSWNIWLIFTTFMLTILGTLLTRSGLVSSVHAFAQSSIGTWFWAFLLIVLSVCLFTYILQRDHLQSEHKLESLVSRESSFLFNNLVLLAACFTILWGTLFPIISEYVEGSKVTVGPPFYNRVAVPIGIFLLFLTGIGPVLAWRSTSFKSVRRNFLWPCVAGAITAAVLMAAGMRPWRNTGTLYSLMTFSLAALVVTAVVSEFWRGTKVIHRHTGKNLLSSVVQLTRRNTRRYGGYLVHIGVVIVFIGFAGSAFNQSTEQEMGFHDSMTLGKYRLVCQSFTQDSNANYDSEYELLNVYKNGKFLLQMAPERRFYHASQQTETMVANHSTLERDLYVVYEGRNQNTNQPIIKVIINPLVAWIWIGLVVMAFGTLLALVPNMAPEQAAKQRKPQAEEEVVLTAGAGD
ncbi:MAG: heme lyase CcmF/NrfE family subunit [Acidobacteriaceae bacterium]